MLRGVASRLALGSERSFSRSTKRELPPSLKLTDRCARQLLQLLERKKDAQAVRIKMVNDWSSSTGFSFAMEFAESKEPGEEMVVQDGARALGLHRLCSPGRGWLRLKCRMPHGSVARVSRPIAFSRSRRRTRVRRVSGLVQYRDRPARLNARHGREPGNHNHPAAKARPVCSAASEREKWDRQAMTQLIGL